MAPYQVPSLFTQNWQPQVMPVTNIALQNNFNNFNLASLGGGQQYPPMQQPMMQQPIMQQPMMNQVQQPMIQTPQQNYGQQPQQQGYNQNQF